MRVGVYVRGCVGWKEIWEGVGKKGMVKNNVVDDPNAPMDSRYGRLGRKEYGRVEGEQRERK